MDKDLVSEFTYLIIKSINEGKSLLEAREILVFFKKKGINNEDMYKHLETLRLINDNDMILDLMDFVIGYCNLNQKI